jgi:hypothetical protein
MFPGIVLPPFRFNLQDISACLESHLEGKKHILKKQNPNFVFGKKKKAWFVKFLALKNHFLEMKLKASFSKCAFNKNHG